ncbi:MAG TPA: hypothetical protein VFJ11_03845 [Gaiellaceae bacterium]|nr:hypothetical protein [Gaiellaceae bacterium]
MALACWLAATVTAIVAAPDLAAGRPLDSAPVLAVHLVTLGLLPFAVSGASFHLLPVMLRNDLPSQRALWFALLLLGGGLLVASGLGRSAEPAVWAGAALVACGLGIVLAEVLMLVARAPRGRALIASRLGVGLSCVHVVAALCLGAVIFSKDAPFAGISYGRWLLIHLHVALLGWIALLIITVGRNLGPMLAQAPAAAPRARPLDELALTAGLWLLLAGIATESRPLTLAGAVVVVLTLGRFSKLVIRTARMRRGPLEAPLVHMLVGGVFLAQAAGFGLAIAAGADSVHMVCGYVVLLLVGWAGGVVLGHIGKLLSLSVWVWWPPGPRPKQAELYPRTLGLAAAAAFAVGVESLAIGAFTDLPTLARAGAGVLCGSALLSIAGAALTWQRRSREST